MDYENGFGVTSRFWDRIFGTELPPPPQPKVLKTTWGHCTASQKITAWDDEAAWH